MDVLVAKFPGDIELTQIQFPEDNVLGKDASVWKSVRIQVVMITLRNSLELIKQNSIKASAKCFAFERKTKSIKIQNGQYPSMPQYIKKKEYRAVLDQRLNISQQIRCC